jgi:hypothetical protein
MNALHYLLLGVILTACSSNDSVTPQQANGCGRLIERGAGHAGQPVTVRAFLKGCKSVVFQVETRSNGALRRVPSSCDLTQDTFTFASPGDTLHLGLFSCGTESIKATYRLEVESKGVMQEYESKVGYTLKYVIK